MTRSTCANWRKKEFARRPASALSGPFLHRHQQHLVIADIELLAIVIAVVIWGVHGAGAVHIVVSGNTNDISRANKQNARRGASAKLLGTSPGWIIHLTPTMLVLYARAHRNTSEDALTRRTVEK